MMNRLHVTALVVVLSLVTLAQGQTFTTLYNFTGGSDGGNPYAGVIQDQSGNLYGTTAYGGLYAYGVVYEVNSSGVETMLYHFAGNTDGGIPRTSVIRDSKGNLYGTTSYGYGDCGVVFEVDSTGKETVLHSFFGGASDGCYPLQGVIKDNKGNLYGTTYRGGASNQGTVFRLSPHGTETLLHSFAGGPSDGAMPDFGHLLMDKAGNLYGVTEEGGSSGLGAAYKLTAKRKETLLHSFAGNSSDGCYPLGSVSMDKAGNLYGTTYACGSSGDGTVWKVSKKGTETILHNFAGGLSDGCHPYAGVVLDSKSNLYGDTSGCGVNTYGTVWQLSARGTLTLLHSFDRSDGYTPFGELLRTAKGELFGSTYGGGSYDYGTVWSYVP
jgi:uncharacterized repeat protein (TIGR03803 family)